VLASGRVYSYLGGRWSARTYSFLLSFLFFFKTNRIEWFVILSVRLGLLFSGLVVCPV
jgi:hypothetical protein